MTLTTPLALRFPGGLPPKAHPVFRHHETSRAYCRCLTHLLDETSLVPPFPRGYPERLLLSEYGKASSFKRSARGCVLPSSVVEIRAVWPSPWDAERSSPPVTTLSLFARCRIGRQRGTGSHQPFSNGPPPNHGMHNFYAPGSPEARVFSTQLPRWSTDISMSTTAS